MLKAAQARPSAEQESLGLGWNHVIWGGRVKTTIPSDAQTTPRLVMEDPKQAWVTNTRKLVKTTKSASNVMEASTTNMVPTPSNLLYYSDTGLIHHLDY
jgi:alpha-galactosidase/6-phospho-beta-glucosidase family protein